MILDAQLLFSDAQAVTAAAASTNLIDTGPLYSGNLGRNLGIGDRSYIFVVVDVAMTDSGSNSTLTVDLQTDDNAAFSSAATVATLTAIAAVTAAGALFVFPLPPAGAVPYERYIRLYYTPNTGDLTAGSFTAGIVHDIQALSYYTSAYSTGL